MERLAGLERSKGHLLEAVESYKRYLAFAYLAGGTRYEFRTASEVIIDHLRFLGLPRQAIPIHEQLIKWYPLELEQRNQLSLTYMMANNIRMVEEVAAETLHYWPYDPMAQLHYGLALKQLYGDYARALPYLQYAVDSKASGTQEPYFYQALGETLQRLGMHRAALELFKRGAKKSFFVSVYQRSLYNEPELRAQPFWLPAETGYSAELAELTRNWRAIRDEAVAVLSSMEHFQEETELLLDKGKWNQYELFARGQRLHRNCQKAPITCGLLGKFTAASGCRRGQIKFSAMQPQTHVWPHCGPTNCRLRAHLTLVAPEPHLTILRVADQQRTWHEGDLFIFDDSFEHEVWHNGTQLRLVLIVDLWHPDLSAAQRKNLTPI